jgi:SsrA-binding protein
MIVENSYFCNPLMADKTIHIKNRRASFEYFFLQTFTTGIVLLGTEIKSLRTGKANLQDAYCFVDNDEVYIKNMHIASYSHATHFNHEPNRDRKLLLNKSEINKIKVKLKDVGLTIIPIKLFINEKGLAKLEIAIAKGKKAFDKRNSIKEKDIERDLKRKF